MTHEVRKDRLEHTLRNHRIIGIRRTKIQLLPYAIILLCYVKELLRREEI